MTKKAEQNPAPDWYLKLEAKYLDAVAKKQEAEEEMEKCKAAMLGLMEYDKLDKISTDFTAVSYKPNYVHSIPHFTSSVRNFYIDEKKHEELLRLLEE